MNTMKTKKPVRRATKAPRGKLPTRKIKGATGNPPKKLPGYNEDGVDITLIQWMLSFTPAERLQIVQQSLRSIQEMQNASRGR